MPKAAIDMVGQIFGSLLVAGRAPSAKGGAHFHCRCDCGGERIVRGVYLRRKLISSCGCMIAGKPRGASKHPLYSIHAGMLDRCENPRSKDYPHYGGRGIRVCVEWHDIQNFTRDMGARPSLQHSIDRIETNGHYEPRNCRWATAKVQSRNRRNNYFPGNSSVEVCAESGVNPGTFRKRISEGWTKEEALDARDHRRRDN